MATVITTAAVVAGLKLAVGRSRPCAGTLVARCAPPSDPSFPSGHAAGIFAFAGFVAMAGVEVVGSRRRHRTLTAGLFTLAAGVAASRVALGVHYPTDVAAGALLGTTLGLYGGAWARRAPNRGEDDPGAPCYDDDVALGATELPAEHRSGP
jgi:undecaprenyl-diphosphatase